MRSTRYFRLLDALEQVSRGPAGSAGQRHRARHDRRESYRKVRKTVKTARRADEAAIAWRPTVPKRRELAIERDHALHRIRKAAKRLRYVAEATGDKAVGKQAKLIPDAARGPPGQRREPEEHLLEQADVAQAAGEDTSPTGCSTSGRRTSRRAARSSFRRP